MKAIVQALCNGAVDICPEPSRRWLQEKYEQIASGSTNELGVLFAAAGRRVGRGRVSLRLEELSLATWQVAELARVGGLLLGLNNQARDEQLRILENLYFRGSADEKRAVLLGLSLVPFPEDHLSLAVEACRTNTVGVFEAIACENDFPAKHFGELQFNQLVLKAIFLELEVQRIHGVKSRVTPTLRSNLLDFKAERMAAGRPVPAGLDWLLA